MKLIITLILILVIIGIILITFFCIRKKVRDTSQALFGTPDITQAAVQMKQEYATTPKSVSSMTSLLLPKISADFPDFEYNEMKDRANNVLVSFLRAITTKDENALSEGSRELKQQLENHIEMLRPRDALNILIRSNFTAPRFTNTVKRTENASLHFRLHWNVFIIPRMKMTRFWKVTGSINIRPNLTPISSMCRMWTK